MEENLRLLAEKLGLSVRFSDAGLIKKDYEVSEDVIRFIADSLGFKAWTADDVNVSLAEIERRRWMQTLDTSVSARLFPFRVSAPPLILSPRLRIPAPAFSVSCLFASVIPASAMFWTVRNWHG